MNRRHHHCESPSVPRPRAWWRLRAWWRDDRGTVTIELVLVIPLVLFLSLLLVQTMLLMTANHVVRYAAYSAARAAIVQVPRDLRPAGGTGPNLLVTEMSDPKFAAVHRAAVYALWPIAGRQNTGDQTADFAAALDAYYAAYGRPSPNWVERLADAKLRYAAAQTRLHFMFTDVRHAREMVFEDMPAGSFQRFGTKAPITTRVEHDFSLTVPIIAGLFAEGRHDADRGGTYYTRIAARCTLNNEGITDTLPAPPTLPRVP